MFNKIQKSYIFKKIFKLKIKNLKFNGFKIGILGMRVLQSVRLLPDQMESIRRVFVRATSRMGRVWLTNKINYQISKKSSGSRMGKGVGSPKTWIIEIKLGQMIVEFSYVSINTSKFIKSVSRKMPVKTEFVFKPYLY